MILISNSFTLGASAPFRKVSKMMAFAFSVFHAEFVSSFPMSSFEECLARLEVMEDYIASPAQQEHHDKLVDATYEFYQVLDTEDLGYVICTE